MARATERWSRQECPVQVSLLVIDETVVDADLEITRSNERTPPVMPGDLAVTWTVRPPPTAALSQVRW
jgi:hypothetical protein